MLYTSTRDSSVRVTASKAITDGISPDGGLYIPMQIPEISLKDITDLAGCGYKERARRILSLYLSDFTDAELKSCIDGAYSDGKFACEQVAPVVKLREGEYILELFHGPTCAFKDMALQMLPYLLTVSAKKNLKDKRIVILVATSGDTGKAALEGFKDVDGTQILVFYPSDGVSNIQKLQMATQEGANVGVTAIKGNFDDAQNGVKAIFTDEQIKNRFEQNGLVFSSANSINWGRLAPQIVYYISAYCELLNSGAITAGDKINITVPTGNFGNILAAYYAMRMGLPVNKLVCASNANRVLTDFIQTGVYNRNREFYLTCSPSMDILISSNLERLLYLLGGCDDAAVRGLMGELKATGSYTVSPRVLSELHGCFCAGCCDDTATKQTIARTFEQCGYLADTHTAVGINVYEAYKASTGDTTPTVIAATASPFKFSAAVLEAIAPQSTQQDEFAKLNELARVSGMSVPLPLAQLSGKAVRFDKVCLKEDMAQAVFDMLGL